MAAIELYKEDGKAAGVFFCSDCRSVYANKEQADGCHGERLCLCGSKIEVPYLNLCNECDRRERQEKERIKEAERFEKAAKVPAAAYKGGMIYGPDGKYYEEIEYAIDQHLEGQEPGYVWACKDVGVIKATTESLYENMLENMWEDADVHDLHGLDELEAAVVAFNEANKNIRVWEVDYSTAVIITKGSAGAAQFRG